MVHRARHALGRGLMDTEVGTLEDGMGFYLLKRLCRTG